MPGGNEASSSSFGGRDKSRGIKHQRDKNKYKPKSVKDPKHVPPKFKRNLGSNWDRYEAGDDSQTYQLTSSTDFSILANAPIAQGQHFQFKEDKILAGEVAKTPQELFSLDLNMLTNSILTIPFYERVGIDEKYFTKNQINFMNRNAEISLVKCSEKYGSTKIDDKNVDIDGEVKIESKNVEDADIATNETEKDEVSELVSKLENFGEECDTKAKTTTLEEELEEWLDDILDD